MIKGRFVSRDYDRAKYLLKKSLIISNALDGLGALRIPSVFLNLAHRYLANNLNRCAEVAIKQGSLHDFQQVGLVSERHLIDLRRAMPKDVFAPTVAKDGYKHLGYYHAEVMAFNDECRAKDYIGLSGREKVVFARRFKDYIQYCELTGQHSSLWKLLANKKRFLEGTGSGDFGDSTKLYSSLSSCEYSRMMKILQMKKFKVGA